MDALQNCSEVAGGWVEGADARLCLAVGGDAKVGAGAGRHLRAVRLQMCAQMRTGPHDAVYADHSRFNMHLQVCSIFAEKPCGLIKILQRHTLTIFYIYIDM